MSAGDLVSGEIKHTATPWRKAPLSMGRYKIVTQGGLMVVGEVSGYNERAEENLDFIVRACNAHDALAKAVQAEFALVCMPIREGEELSKQIGWNGKEDRNIFCRRLRYAAIAALAK